MILVDVLLGYLYMDVLKKNLTCKDYVVQYFGMWYAYMFNQVKLYKNKYAV